MATIEAKSAKCWFFTMMLGLLAAVVWIWFLLPLAVSVVSAWHKPVGTYWWRCAALFSVAGAASLGWSWAFFTDAEGNLGYPLVQAPTELSVWWVVEAINFALAAALVMWPLAAASTWETWRRTRRA